VPKRDLLLHSVRFVRYVVPATVKPARVLWNEAVGFVFLVLAGYFGLSGFVTWRSYTGKPGDLIKLTMITICAVLLGFYGISSFRRARRISRS
jgi:hypothetical protein